MCLDLSIDCCSTQTTSTKGLNQIWNKRAQKNVADKKELRLLDSSKAAIRKESFAHQSHKIDRGVVVL